MLRTINVRCKNTGKTHRVPAGFTMEEVYDMLEINLPYECTSVKVNNKTEGLHYTIYNDKDIEFIDITNPSGMRTYTRSLFFVLYKAVCEVYPQARLRIDTPVSNGYYCRLSGLPAGVNGDVVVALRNKMRAIIDANLPYHRITAPTDEAIALFRQHRLEDKAQLLEGSGLLYTTYYTLGGTPDYFYGSLLINTGQLQLFDLVPYYDGLLLRVPDPKNPEDRNWRNEKGWSLSKWWQGVLKEENTFSSGALRVLWVQGTGLTSMAHLAKIQEAASKLDMIVVAEPFVNEISILSDRKDGVYILPVATAFENEGHLNATNRSGQWRTKVVDPLYESKGDHEVMFAFAKKFGFYDEYVKGMKMAVVDRELKQVKDDFVWPDDATNEIARVGNSIGYGGRTAEMFRRHQANWDKFDPDTLIGLGGEVKGEYYGKPWPAWDEKHPGTPILYDMSKPYAEGGSGFRNRFGLEHNGVSQLASEESTLVGSAIKGGYPQITKDNIEKVLGITLTEEEKAKIGPSWSMDYSGIILEKCREKGVVPYGNARARAIVWEFLDPIPKHREPIHSPRWDLVQKYPTFDDQARNFRVSTKFKSEQQAKDWSKEFPIVFSTQRVVNLSGAGMIERTSKYLSAITPEMFANVHPELALKYGIKDRDMMWIHSPQGTKIKVRCYHSYMVTPDRICMPYNFAGVMQGVDLSARYPEGTKPYVIGESFNTVTNYGFDPVTQISEFNAGLCRIEKAEENTFKTSFYHEYGERDALGKE